MYIKEIELNNFRIYKGVNKIDLTPSADKNVVIVSGKNGYGKTTFLMSLVWCLYGKNMQKVDEMYKKEISDKGGYGKYIGNSLNRLAKAEGESQFSVSVTFRNVKIPEITCSEIKIKRSFDIVTSASDKIEILIDGYKNELIEDLTTPGKQDGEEIFIRDFILPIEIAKFFFFDAEKIVSLAEINSTEQRRVLSKAYTEVLGIKKYEDLKDQLETIQDDYRKKSARPDEKKELINITAEIEKAIIKKDEIEEDILSHDERKSEKRSESDEIQKRLIRSGNLMTIEQLNELKEDEIKLERQINTLQDQLKDFFDLIPFGLAATTIIDLAEHLEIEKKIRDKKFLQEDVIEKTNNILDDLDYERNNFNGVIPREIKLFYEEQIRSLVRKYFFADEPKLPSTFKSLHDFSESELHELNSLVENLKHSFKDSFSKLHDEYKHSKNRLLTIRREIRNAEKNTEDEYISNLRNNKEKLDDQVRESENKIYDLKKNIGALEGDMKRLRQRQEELRKKIDESRQYSAMEQKAQDIIVKLKKFIVSFKEEKKKSLTSNLMNELQLLMHKQDFITKVEVDINKSGNDVDINLFNARDEKIDKGSLSMGERQMYVSALLKALVDESDIEFPVFIDSPMQKFDADHAKNVINEFYPNVSEQVVLFPLIHKELNINEFELILPKIAKSFLIDNYSTDASKFLEVEPENLLKKYDKLYAN